MSQVDSLTGQENRGYQPPPLMLVVTHLNYASAILGNLPKYHYVYNTRIDVETAFDGGITMEIGHPDDTDSFGTAISVASTGVKAPSAGTGVGYDATARQVK